VLEPGEGGARIAADEDLGLADRQGVAAGDGN